MKRCGFWALVVSAFFMLSGAAGANVFFVTVDRDFARAFTGIVRETGPGTVYNSWNSNLPGNFHGDTLAWAFRDSAGAEKLLLREFLGHGGADSIFIYDLNNWDRPLLNTAAWNVTNIMDVVSVGQYLYVVSDTRNIGRDSGEIIKVNMNDYSVAARYPFSVNQNGLLRRPVRVIAYNGHIYVLSNATTDFISWGASEVHKFDSYLTPIGAPAEVGINVGGMGSPAALHEGNLYVACLGTEYGSIWEVDLRNMISRRLTNLDNNFPDYSHPMAYGISIAKDGTALLLIADFYTPAGVYLSSIENLGNPGRWTRAGFTPRTGWSFGALYDEHNGVFWLMNGTHLEVRGRNGHLLRTLTPEDLGGNIYSIAVIEAFSVGGDDDTGGNGGGDNDRGGGSGGCNTGIGLLALLITFHAGLMKIRKK